MGKHRTCLHPDAHSQIRTGIHFQFKSLGVDIELSFLHITRVQKKKKSQAAYCKAGVEKSRVCEMSPLVGSADWLAGRQLIPNAGFRFSHSLIQQWPEAWQSLNA